jgi:segregation and condensation protein B
MDNQPNLQHIVEAVLLTASDPLTVKKLSALLGEKHAFSDADIKSALTQIKEAYQGRALVLVELARGFRFQVAEDMVPWVLQAQAEKPARLSPAFLETLALIAYRQPITRADIEAVRGVAVSASMLRAMLDRGWVKVVGHREVPGRPELLATTPQFLDDFNLKCLTDLPVLADVEACLESPQLSLDVDGEQDVNAVVESKPPTVDVALNDVAEDDMAAADAPQN